MQSMLTKRHWQDWNFFKIFPEKKCIDKIWLGGMFANDFICWQIEDDDMFSNDLGNDDPGAEMSIGTDESNSRLVEEVRLKDVAISQLRNRLLHLEKARMDKVPVDAAREISRLHGALVSSLLHFSPLSHSLLFFSSLLLYSNGSFEKVLCQISVHN